MSTDEVAIPMIAVIRTPEKTSINYPDIISISSIKSTEFEFVLLMVAPVLRMDIRCHV